MVGHSVVVTMTDPKEQPSTDREERKEIRNILRGRFGGLTMRTQSTVGTRRLWQRWPPQKAKIDIHFDVLLLFVFKKEQCQTRKKVFTGDMAIIKVTSSTCLLW